ncbi:ATP-binding protein [bacterium]|nr:ATP-binding protein [bacterium]
MAGYREQRQQQKIDSAIQRYKLFIEKKEYQSAADACEQVSRLYTEFAAMAGETYEGAEQQKKRRNQARKFKDLAVRVRTGRVGGGDSGDGHDGTPTPEAISGEHADAVKRLVVKSPVTWNRIGGLEKTKHDIKFAYGLTMAQLPEGIRMEAWRNIMFYGPPGTGKTLLAGATSNGLDATFFNVKVSSVMSKWFGESTKIISELYDMAREMHPSVVFFDEFESITQARDSGNDSGPERRILSTILAELDGLTESNETAARYVMTIAATNAPADVDRAVLSRFQKRVFIPLPDRAAREQILKINITDLNIPCEADLGRLAESMKMYSGREISSICKIAISAMIEEKNDRIPGLVDKGKDAVSEYRMQIRPLTEKDFSKVLREIRPATPEKPTKTFEQWITNVPAD